MPQNKVIDLSKHFMEFTTQCPPVGSKNSGQDATDQVTAIVYGADISDTDYRMLAVTQHSYLKECVIDLQAR